VGQVERLPAAPATADEPVALVFLRLLVPVMARLAQALQVLGVQKESAIAAMRNHVVDHGCRHE
jgi:hypothetical protein